MNKKLNEYAKEKLFKIFSYIAYIKIIQSNCIMIKIIKIK